MKIDVLSLFPELITSYCSTSILGHAQSASIYELATYNPRYYSKDKHHCVDDTPYGGGAGMLLSCEPYFDCLEDVLAKRGICCDSLEKGVLEHESNRDYEIITTTPSGEIWTQELAEEFSQKNNLIILCGRYEGFDERIRKLASREISVGDYVLTGGELPALTIIDSVLRLLPGVLGEEASKEYESFSTINYLELFKDFGVTKRETEEFLKETSLNSIEDLKELKLLEHPHYTKPADFRGQKVPEVLLSGDHKKIFLWRLKSAIKLTNARFN
jgi:tRNA (guanine37-N1)-methyltransferase